MISESEIMSSNFDLQFTQFQLTCVEGSQITILFLSNSDNFTKWYRIISCFDIKVLS
jgi:hypothetical protein